MKRFLLISAILACLLLLLAACNLSSDTPDVPDTGHEHLPAAPVVENAIAASCTEGGSYDNVVYCSSCGEELSRETITVAALGHTPGEAQRENEIAATCTESGR